LLSKNENRNFLLALITDVKYAADLTPICASSVFAEFVLESWLIRVKSQALEKQAGKDQQKLPPFK
jgi:hypothetical protein